jgi:hypothetical protein
LSNSNKNILEAKLDEYIRKYYLNQSLRGLLIGMALVLLYLLLALLLEFFGHFGTTVRMLMFFVFVSLSLLVFTLAFVFPILRRYKVLKSITRKEASSMIGTFFPEIKDKLLNTLQLQDQSEQVNNELLLASIQQRIENLKPFTFSSAISLGNSAKKYGRYTLIPVLVFVFILIFQSSMITKPAKRIIGFNQQFAKEAPFEFILKNKNLNLIRNSDCELLVELKGKQIPAVLYVNIDGHLIKMEQMTKTLFSHTLYNLSSSHLVVFTDGDYESIQYNLNVLPKPNLNSFEVKLNYPSYINKKNEVLKNIGDFTVPEGTKLDWIFEAVDADLINFNINGKDFQLEPNGRLFSFNYSAHKNSNYNIVLQNKFIQDHDTIKYSLQVVPDRYPGIVAEQTIDSINPFKYYFYGKLDDDYGISKLQFVYKGEDGILKYLPVNVGKSTDEIFYYMIDLTQFKGSESSSFEYYFEVWDNDAVNGRKSSKSQLFKVQTPSEKELRADAENSSSSVKSKLNETMREIQNLQKKSSELSKDLMDKSELDWAQEQKIKDFINEQKKLEQKLESIKTENLKNNEKQKQLSPLDQELLDKQKELDKLFNEILTPEMKALLKKLEESLKQQNKDAVQQQLEKMNQSNDEMKKQVDRALEQFKQMELEKRINEHANALEKLAQEQKELAKKTEEKLLSKDELAKEQEALNKKFEELKKDMEKTDEKNKALESPLELEDTKAEQESIQENLNESSESIDKKQNKKAAESQKKSADEMEKLAEKMKKSMEQSKEDQAQEDYYTLRQILENLIELSVQQEALMSRMKDMHSYNPKYVELSSLQQKLKENAKMVEDSLLALSKRQIHIKSFVNKEIGNINYNMDAAIEYFGKVQIQGGTSRQQYVMTGLNNLAVMLSESLKQMQESMKEKKDQKKGQCKNPGKKPGKPGQSGKPKMSGMKQMQDEINKQLQEMKSGKQQGKNPGTEQYAKIAAQQEALRREIERLQKLLKEEGNSGALGDLEKTKQLMEQQERDLVNKQINQETMRRMQEIETRMLEHERAEREQKTDNKREAEQANAVENEMPPAMKSYLEKKAREMELLRSVPTNLSPYYKDRVRVYFQKVGTV